jgi:hypothetical protein
MANSMRMSSIGLIVLGALVIGATAPVRAQSLADIARKEEERRRHTKTGKVYTNDDLSPTPGRGAGDTTSAAADAKSGDTKDAKDADGKDAKGDDKKSAKSDDKKDANDQATWSKRMSGLRESLQRDQVYADALQSRINALTTDFVNRDDPAQRAQIGAQRESAVAELARLKKQIQDDQKSISDAEEDARRSGVPAGWLR